jgi:serine/threonine protein kinase
MGSLDRGLHPDANALEKRQKVALDKRLNVAVDVVKALNYLHNCVGPTIHSDFKPSNNSIRIPFFLST